MEQEDVGEDKWTAEPLKRKQSSSSLWGRHMAKKRRDSGLEYVSDKTKKVIQARSVGPPKKIKIIKCACNQKYFLYSIISHDITLTSS